MSAGATRISPERRQLVADDSATVHKSKQFQLEKTKSRMFSERKRKELSRLVVTKERVRAWETRNAQSPFQLATNLAESQRVLQLIQAEVSAAVLENMALASLEPRKRTLSPLNTTKRKVEIEVALTQRNENIEMTKSCTSLPPVAPSNNAERLSVSRSTTALPRIGTAPSRQGHQPKQSMRRPASRGESPSSPERLRSGGSPERPRVAGSAPQGLKTQSTAKERSPNATTQEPASEPIHTEILSNLHSSPVIVSLFCVSFADGKSVRKYDPLNLLNSSGPERLMLKVYDPSTSKEATTAIHVREYTQLLYQLRDKYSSIAEEHFKPGDSDWWIEFLKRGLVLRFRGGDLVAVTVSKNAIEKMVADGMASAQPNPSKGITSKNNSNKNKINLMAAKPNTSSSSSSSFLSRTAVSGSKKLQKSNLATTSTSSSSSSTPLLPIYSELVSGVYEWPVTVSLLVVGGPNWRQQADPAYAPMDMIRYDPMGIRSEVEPCVRRLVIKVVDLVESCEASCDVPFEDMASLLIDLRGKYTIRAIMHFNPLSVTWWVKNVKKVVDVTKIKHHGKTSGDGSGSEAGEGIAVKISSDLIEMLVATRLGLSLFDDDEGKDTDWRNVMAAVAVGNASFENEANEVTDVEDGRKKSFPPSRQNEQGLVLGVETTSCDPVGSHAMGEGVGAPQQVQVDRHSDGAMLLGATHAPSHPTHPSLEEHGVMNHVAPNKELTPRGRHAAKAAGSETGETLSDRVTEEGGALHHRSKEVDEEVDEDLIDVSADDAIPAHIGDSQDTKIPRSIPHYEVGHDRFQVFNIGDMIGPVGAVSVAVSVSDEGIPKPLPDMDTSISFVPAVAAEKGDNHNQHSPVQDAGEEGAGDVVEFTSADDVRAAIARDVIDIAVMRVLRREQAVALRQAQALASSPSSPSSPSSQVFVPRTNGTSQIGIEVLKSEFAHISLYTKMALAVLRETALGIYLMIDEDSTSMAFDGDDREMKIIRSFVMAVLSKTKLSRFLHLEGPAPADHNDFNFRALVKPSHSTQSSEGTDHLISNIVAAGDVEGTEAENTMVTADGAADVIKAFVLQVLESTLLSNHMQLHSQRLGPSSEGIGSGFERTSVALDAQDDAAMGAGSVARQVAIDMLRNAGLYSLTSESPDLIASSDSLTIDATNEREFTKLVLKSAAHVLLTNSPTPQSKQGNASPKTWIFDEDEDDASRASKVRLITLDLLQSAHLDVERDLPNSNAHKHKQTVASSSVSSPSPRPSMALDDVDLALRRVAVDLLRGASLDVPSPKPSRVNADFAVATDKEVALVAPALGPASASAPAPASASASPSAPAPATLSPFLGRQDSFEDFGLADNEFYDIDENGDVGSAGPPSELDPRVESTMGPNFSFLSDIAEFLDDASQGFNGGEGEGEGRDAGTAAMSGAMRRVDSMKLETMFRRISVSAPTQVLGKLASQQEAPRESGDQRSFPSKGSENSKDSDGSAPSDGSEPSDVARADEIRKSSESPRTSSRLESKCDETHSVIPSLKLESMFQNISDSTPLPQGWDKKPLLLEPSREKVIATEAPAAGPSDDGERLTPPAPQVPTMPILDSPSQGGNREVTVSSLLLRMGVAQPHSSDDGAEAEAGAGATRGAGLGAVLENSKGEAPVPVPVHPLIRMLESQESEFVRPKPLDVSATSPVPYNKDDMRLDFEFLRPTTPSSPSWAIIQGKPRSPSGQSTKVQHSRPWNDDYDDKRAPRSRSGSMSPLQRTQSRDRCNSAEQIQRSGAQSPMLSRPPSRQVEGFHSPPRPRTQSRDRSTSCDSLDSIEDAGEVDGSDVKVKKSILLVVPEVKPSSAVEKKGKKDRRVVLKTASPTRLKTKSPPKKPKGQREEATLIDGETTKQQVVYASGSGSGGSSDSNGSDDGSKLASKMDRDIMGLIVEGGEETVVDNDDDDDSIEIVGVEKSLPKRKPKLTLSEKVAMDMIYRGRALVNSSPTFINRKLSKVERKLIQSPYAKPAVPISAEEAKYMSLQMQHFIEEVKRNHVNARGSAAFTADAQSRREGLFGPSHDAKHGHADLFDCPVDTSRTLLTNRSSTPWTHRSTPPISNRSSGPTPRHTNRSQSPPTRINVTSQDISERIDISL